MCFVRKSYPVLQLCAILLVVSFSQPQVGSYFKILDKLLLQFCKIKVMFLKKVLTSHFCISERGEAHNNMPKSIFMNNSINCCLREPSLEKTTL